MAAIAASQGYVLFFTPEAGVVPHFTAQAVVARTLKERGHKILMVRCMASLARCPVMDMYILPFADPAANQKQTCAQCVHVAKLFQDGWGLDYVSLSDLLNAEIISEVAKAIGNAPDDLREFVYDGIQFGKLCIIDLVHATKTSRFESVGPEIRNAWKQYLSSALTSYLMVRRLCRELPVSAIVTHEDYSPLIAARLAGRAEGVPAVTMTICQHNSGDRRRYQFFQMPAWGQAFLNIQAWPQFRDLAIPPERVQAAMDDVLVRFAAPNAHVYSPQKTFEQGDFRGKIGIPKGRKVLALFTSSLDEMIAATSQQDAIDLPRIRLPQTFKDQIEWIRAVIAFVKDEPGYHLVVRIHPREGANKREGLRSQHLLMLQEAFGGEYPNVQIIWPETQVSSYDLAEVADLVLVSWSTMGIELSRLGVPVLASTFGNAPRPWDDFHEWAPTPREYFRKLRAMAGAEPGLEAVQHAFRWYNMHYFGFTLDFSDVIPAKDFHGVPPYKLPASAAQVERAILGGEDVLSTYKDDLRSAQSAEAREAEEAALKRHMRRAVHCLMTREDREADITLIYAADARAADGIGAEDAGAVARGEAALLIGGTDSLEYRCGGTTSRRHSPMVHRLARLAFRRALGDVNLSVTPMPSASPSGRDADAKSWSPAPSGRGPAGDFAEAGRLRAQGDLRGARALAEASMRAHGESPEWATFLGHLAHLEGDPQAAKRAWLDVSERWPAYGKAHNNLAALCWAEGDRAPALEHMARALELEPDQRDIVLNGTRILSAMGMDQEARTLRDAYLRKHPEDSDALKAIPEPAKAM